jgi:hypothetical protein
MAAAMEIAAARGKSPPNEPAAQGLTAFVPHPGPGSGPLPSLAASRHSCAANVAVWTLDLDALLRAAAKAPSVHNEPTFLAGELTTLGLLMFLAHGEAQDPNDPDLRGRVTTPDDWPWNDHKLATARILARELSASVPLGAADQMVGSGLSMLHVAAERGWPEVVANLLNANASLTPRTNRLGGSPDTPLAHAMKYRAAPGVRSMSGERVRDTERVYVLLVRKQGRTPDKKFQEEAHDNDADGSLLGTMMRMAHRAFECIFLIAIGVSLTRRDAATGMAPVHHLHASGNWPTFALIRARWPGDVTPFVREVYTATDAAGRTAAHCAALAAPPAWTGQPSAVADRTHVATRDDRRRLLQYPAKKGYLVLGATAADGVPLRALIEELQRGPAYRASGQWHPPFPERAEAAV